MQRRSFEIQDYVVSMGGLKNHTYNHVHFNYYATIRCTKGDNLMLIYFLAPESEIPANYGNVRNDEPSYGRIFVPISQLDAYVDLLRNESPVYAHVFEDQPDYMGISTSEEPVGEGE